MKKHIVYLLVWLVSVFFFSPVGAASKQQLGQKVAMDYCQACHMFKGSEQAGTLGPPLIGIKARFPQRDRLSAILHDPQSVLSPFTMMPPFGRNGIMSAGEIDVLIEFLYTL